jgi:DNA-binding MarR family transcriptional regulator
MSVTTTTSATPAAEDAELFEGLRPHVPQVQERFSSMARRASLPRNHNYFSARAGTHLDWYGFSALNWIGSAGPLRLTQLAVHFGVVPSTVCRHVKQLEAEGLVRSEPDPSDGRANLLSPTERGWQVLRGIRRARSEAMEEALADWSDDDLQLLDTLFERFDRDLAAWRDRIEQQPPQPELVREA